MPRPGSNRRRKLRHASQNRPQLNLIKQDSTAKTSLKAKRKKAAWDDEYMAKFIAGKFHV